MLWSPKNENKKMKKENQRSMTSDLLSGIIPIQTIFFLSHNQKNILHFCHLNIKSENLRNLKLKGKRIRRNKEKKKGEY